jgi:hypothetical protein
VHGEHSVKAGESLQNLATVLDSLDMRPKAETALRAALKINRSQLGPR